MNLTSAVECVAEAAGWKIAKADSDGIVRYFLEDGLDLEMRSPDGVTCIVSAVLGALEPAGSVQADEQLRRVASLSAACARERASIVTCSHGQIELFRSFSLQTVSPADLVAQVRDFLNDQAWWRESLSGRPQTSASPFAQFDPNWFPGQFNF